MSVSKKYTQLVGKGQGRQYELLHVVGACMLVAGTSSCVQARSI